jgi:hypothetical protein
MEPPKIDLTIWGYIPGSHLFYCSQCMQSAHIDGNWPHKGDSRSTRCIQHAMDARLNDLREKEGELLAEFGRNPVEQAIFEHEQRMGSCIRALALSAIAGLLTACGIIAYFY